MELQTLANLLVAVTAAHTLHSIMEPINIRAKLDRLVAYMDKKPAKEIPVKIDTRVKGIGLGYAIAVVLFLVFFAVVSVVDPSVRTAIIVSIVLITVIELINTITIDAYHADIEKVTKRFKKN